MQGIFFLHGLQYDEYIIFCQFQPFVIHNLMIRFTGFCYENLCRKELIFQFHILFVREHLIQDSFCSLLVSLIQSCHFSVCCVRDFFPFLDPALR